MKKIYVDWSHKEDKLAVTTNGVKITNKIPKLKEKDQIITENIPMKIAKKFLIDNIEIYRCNTRITAEYRKEHKLEKNDNIDVVVIKTLYDKNPNNFERWYGTPNSTALYRLFIETQKERIANENRKWIFGESEGFKKYLDNIKYNEKIILKEAEVELKQHKIYTEYLKKIKGIGPALSLGLIGIIINKGIINFDNASSLRHYMGLHPIKHPKKDIMIAARYIAGKQADFSIQNKTFMLGRVCENLIKQNTFYKKFYDEYKNYQLNKIHDPKDLKNWYYKKEETKLSKGHAHNRAKRRMAQLFLDHLWVIWRQMEGLSTRTPYPIEKLGHTKYIKPSVIPKSLQPFKSFV